MLFQRINREDAERVFAIFYNVAGATITAGYPACWDVTAPDGVAVTKPAAGSLGLVVGISTEAIADSAYGKFQLYGYKASALVTNTTDNAVAAGDPLIPVDAQWYLGEALVDTVASEAAYFLYAAEAFATAATPAAANKKVFIRCL